MEKQLIDFTFATHRTARDTFLYLNIFMTATRD